MDTSALTPSRPRLRYAVYGEGTPVVMVMGLGMRGKAWRPQVEKLREHHKVVFFDNRGIPNSDRLAPDEERFTMRTLGDDVARLMDDIDVDRAHLVGVSLGGMIAQEAALHHRDRFMSLSLIATHAGGPATWVPPLRGIRKFLRAQTRDDDRRIRAVEELLYPKKFRLETDRKMLDERMRVSFEQRPPKRVVRLQLRAVVRHDTAERLQKLDLPSLVISPDLDILIRPSACRRLADLIPGARLERLADAGHGLVYQSADHINGLLLEHFRSAEA